MSLTLNFVYAFGLQFKDSWSVYPPRPGRPGSPGGLGIFESSDGLADEVDEPLSDTESMESESEGMGDWEGKRSGEALFGYGEEKRMVFLDGSTASLDTGLPSRA
jgi:hypothetical protein